MKAANDNLDKESLVTHEDVKRLFKYDDDTGDLIWIERPSSDFISDAACAS